MTFSDQAFAAWVKIVPAATNDVFAKSAFKAGVAAERKRVIDFVNKTKLSSEATAGLHSTSSTNKNLAQYAVAVLNTLLSFIGVPE